MTRVTTELEAGVATLVIDHPPINLMTAFLATGGQTPDGERRLGDLAGEL